MRFPVTIGLRRSSFLWHLALATHGIAGSLVWLPDWPREVPLLLSLGLLWSLVRSRRIELPAALRLQGDGRLSVQIKPEDGFEEAAIGATVLVHPLLIVFEATCGGRCWHIVLAPDSADGEDQRRLRVWLRWRPRPSAGRG